MPKLYPDGIERVETLPSGGRVYHLSNGDQIEVDNITASLKKYKILRGERLIGTAERLATGLRIANETML